MASPPTPGIDAGAVLWSARERDRAGRPLLVMMHGWSYDESHLFGFAPQLPPEVVVASLRANTAEAGGYAWFPSRGNPIGDPRPEVANHAVREVLAWLDTQPAHPSVGLLGFSQGGAMALQLMRHAPERFGYAVNLAGFAVRDALPGDLELTRRRPPVFWGRGGRDGVIPPVALTRTADWLNGHASADVRVYPRLSHDVTVEEFTDVAEFVAAQL